MTIAEDRPTRGRRKAAAPQELVSTDPRTGEVVATFPVHSEQDVRDAVARAQEAAQWWRDLGFDGRRTRLDAWRRLVVSRLDELCRLIERENGKPYADAQIEVLITVDHLAWATKHAKRVLSLRKVRGNLLVADQKAYVEYVPYGVVGVIGPWNYPLHTPAGSISYALAAGNAVVYKPSEWTPAVGAWFVDAFREVVPEQPVLQLVTGYGETGAALCRAGVGKLAFTGSSATGRKVMAACAETLTPVLMECGGKDAMVVADDADVDAAADAAVWGGMWNAGQTCAGIERVYVTEKVHDEFVRKVVERAKALEVGKHYGPITMPGQVDVIRRHVEAAQADGGTLLLGGRVDGNLVEPTVVTDVPEDSAALTEETFGPVIVVNKAKDDDEAVERANRSTFGLSGAVFSRRRGMELARRLKGGMVSVNGVLAFAGIPSLPFGGSGESGFGRIHGEDGLREFAQAKAITVPRFKTPMPVMTFARTAKTDERLTRILRLVHGRG